MATNPPHSDEQSRNAAAGGPGGMPPGGGGAGGGAPGGGGGAPAGPSGPGGGVPGDGGGGGEGLAPPGPGSDRPALKRKKRPPEHEEEHGELNLTAMIDVMTIILVFLLKSYSTSPLNIPVTDQLNPPLSSTKLSPEDAVTVTISETAILVNDEQVCDVVNGKVDASLKPHGETSLEITPIIGALGKAVTDMSRTATGFNPRLMLIADRKTPYRLLTEVLTSAGRAGFNEFKLVVLVNR
ncbi:MAG TPA: biopolymer transporter ExbD [Myxococcota bacterium]|nr:biopolymer transporter ExbD [Myxococcota bacterium]